MLIYLREVIKEIKYRIPVIPFSALCFFSLAIILWKLEWIPNPKEIVYLLENLYIRYGYFGLVLATFIESIVYLGFYFPGSVIIALAVFFSDGSFTSLLTISILVAITLTVTSTINYLFGKYISRNDFLDLDKDKIIKESKLFSKGLLLSMLHPNFLAFYFFNAGLKRHNFKKIIFVPIFMIPYGYLFGFLLSRFSKVARQGLESTSFLITAIFIWIVVSFVIENRRIKEIE